MRHLRPPLAVLIGAAAYASLLVGCSAPVRPIKAVLWIGGTAHEWEPAAQAITTDLRRRLPIDITLVRDTSFLDSPEADHLDVILMHHCYAKVDGVIDGARQRKLLELVSNGVGVVGLHASYYSFIAWDAYHDLFGARWIKHGDVGVVLEVRNVDPRNPITSVVPATFEVATELYQSTPLDPSCHVLTMAREKRGSPEYPSAWTHAYGAGRVVAILPGHGPDAYAVPAFQQLIAASTLWAAHRPVHISPISTEPAS